MHSFCTLHKIHVVLRQIPITRCVLQETQSKMSVLAPAKGVPRWYGDHKFGTYTHTLPQYQYQYQPSRPRITHSSESDICHSRKLAQYQQPESWYWRPPRGRFLLHTLSQYQSTSPAGRDIPTCPRVTSVTRGNWPSTSSPNPGTGSLLVVPDLGETVPERRENPFSEVNVGGRVPLSVWYSASRVTEVTLDAEYHAERGTAHSAIRGRAKSPRKRSTALSVVLSIESDRGHSRC
jgi:hypothetical protein